MMEVVIIEIKKEDSKEKRGGFWLLILQVKESRIGRLGARHFLWEEGHTDQCSGWQPENYIA